MNCAPVLHRDFPANLAHTVTLHVFCACYIFVLASCRAKNPATCSSAPRRRRIRRRRRRRKRPRRNQPRSSASASPTNLMYDGLALTTFFVCDISRDCVYKRLCTRHDASRSSDFQTVRSTASWSPVLLTSFYFVVLVRSHVQGKPPPKKKGFFDLAAGDWTTSTAASTTSLGVPAGSY